MFTVKLAMRKEECSTRGSFNNVTMRFQPSPCFVLRTLISLSVNEKNATDAPARKYEITSRKIMITAKKVMPSTFTVACNKIGDNNVSKKL